MYDAIWGSGDAGANGVRLDGSVVMGWWALDKMGLSVSDVICWSSSRLARLHREYNRLSNYHDKCGDWDWKVRYNG